MIDMTAGGARMMRRNRLGILSAGTVTSWNWHVDDGIDDVLECNGDRILGFGMPEGVVDSGMMSDGMRVLIERGREKLLADAPDGALKPDITWTCRLRSTL